jgi:dCMP deaminase
METQDETFGRRIDGKSELDEALDRWHHKAELRFGPVKHLMTHPGENKPPNVEKWDRRFLDAAQLFSYWSKDTSTKVGAVIVDPHRRIVATGYNGFARGVDDTMERLEKRELKYEMIIHAEDNALLFAQRDVSLCALYTYPFMPCSRCAAKIIQAGISRVVSFESMEPRWLESFKLSMEMFKEAGVNLTLYSL